MCKMCDGNRIGSCQYCSVWVCWDVKVGDDIIKPATSYNGDLCFIDCASQMEEEMREAEEGRGWMEFGPYNPDHWETDGEYGQWIADQMED